MSAGCRPRLLLCWWSLWWSEGTAAASGRGCHRLGLRQVRFHAPGWRCLAIGQAKLPTATQGSVGLNQAGRDLALSLRQQVLLLHQRLLDLCNAGEVDRAAFILG